MEPEAPATADERAGTFVGAAGEEENLLGESQGTGDRKENRRAIDVGHLRATKHTRAGLGLRY